MRIALVHDSLCRTGGAERVFQYMCQALPEADVFALAYNPSATYSYFASRQIHTTWLNAIVRSGSTFQFSYPIATHVMEQLNLKGYDVIVSASATVAKYARAQDTPHVCYCFMPTRALWQFNEFFRPSFVSFGFKLLLPYLKAHDYRAAQRIQHFVAQSRATQEYIRQFYNRDSELLPGPIETSGFYPSKEKNGSFLVVSRLEHWKRVDYAIEAFNRLGLPLRVVGTGPEENRLRALARNNITFLGAVDDETLAREYSQALAVIYTPSIEYGLIPLEATASGTPVVCYGRGGVTETMIPVGGQTDAQKPTAVFFQEQSAEALIDVLRHFNPEDFNAGDLVRHASQWSVPVFQEKFRELILRRGGHPKRAIDGHLKTGH